VPIIVIVVLLGRVEDQTYSSPTLVASGDKNLIVANSEKIINNPLADPYYKFKVALNLIDAGYLDKGIDIVKSLSEDDPRQIDYLKVLVRAEMTRNNLTEAVELRESISKLDPWNAQNYFEMALLYKSLGNNKQVKKIKEIILDINTSTGFSNQAKLELN
jgi:tetratricopeptide (TPR) repeat protein